MGLGSGVSFAAISCPSCANPTIATNITRDLGGDDNSVGKVLTSSDFVTASYPIVVNVSQESYVNEWFVFSGESIAPVGTHRTSWAFYKVDDYISYGLRFVNNCGVEHYAPFNAKVLREGDCHQQVYTPETSGDMWYPRIFQTAIRIDKKIISGTYSKNIFVGEYGICANAAGDCRSKDVVLSRLYISLDITVPQTCELNAGQVINIDFGNVSSGAFKTAGAIAQGVQPKSRDISVKCDNIAGNAQLTLRLQADKTNGNIVVSDENNDVGFRVTNNSGTPLIPNNLSSVIPFTLDSNARQNVTIQAYPVSVTGNKPTEGPVTSRGYLRVDFP
ncbi:fimbrial protein [Serratia marcescens]|nr:fimbrial protein [Serratia marcescens]HEJ0404573.1 fimbrial protein [Serratia marcescens]HEJ7314919.1 fimbrial protein [Serratia marcescens]